LIEVSNLVDPAMLRDCSPSGIGRIPFLKDWIEKRFELIQGVESALFDFHHKTPKLFWCGFSLNLAGQCFEIQ